MITQLIINTEFAALHHWKTIPDLHTQYYLKYPHRHIFHIRLKFLVEGHDRELEFIEIKNMFDAWLKKQYSACDVSHTPNIGSQSCEMLAAYIIENYRIFGANPIYVRVLEDGENGAEIFYPH